MKTRKNLLMSLSLMILLVLPTVIALNPVSAEEDDEYAKSLPVSEPRRWNETWYRFDSPLITLIFPASGRKPMFIWWYTNDSSRIYVVKFKGVIEYLRLDKPYYRHRFHAENTTINATLWNDIKPRLQFGWHLGKFGSFRQAVKEFSNLLRGLHRAFLPFSACNWTLTGPKLVKTENSTYWSFNFTLTDVYGRRGFEFAENNIQIRCRFYNTTTTETPDPSNKDYNYTVAAGQLKFDFVVNHWEWNVDKINEFLENNGLEPIPTNRTGLALWINMASINIDDLECARNEVEYEAQHHIEAQVQIESRSKMQKVSINGEYCPVEQDETDQDEKPIEATLRLRERFRERIRLHFHCGKTDVPVGFLEFVPWARLLNETGDTVGFVNVTASYIAAGHHLRLFICYPYFGNYTLEHDPTIGLASAPQLPTLLTPEVIAILMLATVIITIAILAYRRKKETINIISP